MDFEKIYKFYTLPQAGKDILYSLKIGRGKLARFLMALKDFGMEVRYRINIANDTSNTQFVIAHVVSVEEIKDDNHYIIENNEKQLMKMQTINVRKILFTVGRITVLMNVPYWHGEARLLDPKGELWSKVADIEDIQRRDYVNMPNETLKKLRDRFQNQHGSSKRSVLIIHSHLIPCTGPRHQCAELIATYAGKTADNTIVSYDVTYKDTDTEKAIVSMTKCDNIYLCHTQEFRPYMNDEVYKMKNYFDRQKGPKTNSKKWIIKPIIHNRWTDNDPEVFPTMTRTNRRAKTKGTKAAARLFIGRPIKSKPKNKDRVTSIKMIRHIEASINS